MRVAVLSDTHFGDELCTLVSPGDPGDSQRVGPAYDALKQALGRVDFLVLLGDILDFSVASYERAYTMARVFFRKVWEDELAKQFIYVPGNHDFDIWHTVEQQVNVINQLKQGQLPRAFKRSVPGVIDDRRTSPDEKFLLPGVTPKPEWHDKHLYYGNLFLDHLISKGRRRGPKLTFNFAYPNLYLITDSGDSVLLTHGHYFETYWSTAAEWVERLAGDDLDLEVEGELNLREMVGINMPLNQLACTGIGQAQPLTELARRLQTEVAAGRSDRVEKYFDRLVEYLRKGAPSYARRNLQVLLIRWLKRRVLRALQNVEQTRYSKEFIHKAAVRDRFRKYYHYSINETHRVRRQYGIDIPPPTHVIFGHTHQPIPWGSGELIDRVNDHTVQLCNTGGWLLRQQNGSFDFLGAEVVLYETGQGMHSVSIRAKDLADVASVQERNAGSVRSSTPP